MNRRDGWEKILLVDRVANRKQAVKGLEAADQDEDECPIRARRTLASERLERVSLARDRVLVAADPPVAWVLLVVWTHPADQAATNGRQRVDFVGVSEGWKTL